MLSTTIPNLEGSITAWFPRVTLYVSVEGFVRVSSNASLPFGLATLRGSLTGAVEPRNGSPPARLVISDSTPANKAGAASAPAINMRREQRSPGPCESLSTLAVVLSLELYGGTGLKGRS